MAKSVTLITLYSVCFKGLFGRNRSEKFRASDPFEAPDGIAPAEFCKDQANAFASNIGAKHGRLWVIRYDNSEKTDHGDGVTTYTIPITQGVKTDERTIGATFLADHVKHVRVGD
jgi:hypothetical protein